MPTNTSLTLIAFSTMDNYTMASVPDIICCLAQGGYSRILIAGREGLLVANGLAKLKEFLPAEQFVRVHNNAIVNLRHVRTMHKGDDKAVVLSNGARLELADRRWKGLLGRWRIF